MKEKKEVPDLCSVKANCCGCAACCALCPARAISMVADEEGFLYPQIDSEGCIGCCICLTACKFKEHKQENGYV